MDKDTLVMTQPLTNSGTFNTRMLAWTGTGLLVFISAFIWAPSRDGLEAIYALAFFIPMLCALLVRKPDFRAYGGWPTLLALSYGALCALSSLWGEPDDFSFFILQWCVLAVWLCGVSWLHTCRPINFQRLYQLLAIVGALVALSTVAEFYWQHPFSYRLEAWTVARNPIVVGQIFGVVALLALVLSWQANSAKLSALFFICALCALLPLGLSQSRGPVLAFLAAFVFALICVRPRRAVWLAQLLALILVSVILTQIPDIKTILFAREVSLSLRDVIWLEVLEQSWRNPWFGIGLAKDTFIMIEDVALFHHAHNSWVDTFYRTGLVGLTLALLHLAALLRKFTPRSPILPLYLWLVFGIGCQLSDSRLLFWQIDAKWFLYWIPAGLIAAALMNPDPAGNSGTKKSGG